MLPRRNLLIIAATGLAGAWLGLPAARAQTVGQATAFVRQTGDALVAVVNGSGSEAERRAQLRAIVERTVDVDGIARFCLGRFARIATPTQMAEYTQLFHNVLAINITGHLGDYRGVSFTVNRAAPTEDGVGVDTTVVRPNNAPADVQWVVTLVGGQPKIVDVIAEGTSLRLTQRSDYASYMSRNGNSVGALIQALQRQAGQ
jgi:phospholipid transport system substrate-binding protein